MGVPLSQCFIKTKNTPQLKNIVNARERKQILENTFSISNNALSGKKILLLDDLYSSGATLNCASNVLFNQGKVKSVFVLAITKTRKSR
ncbi:MAG: hypothetical protein ABIH39_05160 [Candidatus Margulisiibacteriota bacterium]